jgi:hypothetical protein
MSRTALFMAATVSLLTGCPGPAGPGTIPQQNVAAVNTPVGRPGWIPTPNRSHPNVLYVTGACRGQLNIQAARRCAKADAQRQIKKQMGSATVEIKGDYLKDEYFERRRVGAGPIVHDGWVLVAYPRQELRKEQARIANRVLLGVTCNSDTMGACDERVKQTVEQAMTSAGLKPAPEGLESGSATDTRAAMASASKQRAAKLLLAVVDGKFLSAEDGEFYSQANCHYRIIDAISGKVLSSKRFGPVKTGHINRKDAVAKAIDKCTAKLKGAIASE